MRSTAFALLRFRGFCGLLSLMATVGVLALLREGPLGTGLAVFSDAAGTSPRDLRRLHMCADNNAYGDDVAINWMNKALFEQWRCIHCGKWCCSASHLDEPCDAHFGVRRVHTTFDNLLASESYDGIALKPVVYEVCVEGNMGAMKARIWSSPTLVRNPYTSAPEAVTFLKENHLKILRSRDEPLEEIVFWTPTEEQKHVRKGSRRA